MTSPLKIVLLLVVGTSLPAGAQVVDSRSETDPIRLMRASMPGIWHEGRVQAWTDGSLVLRLSPGEAIASPDANEEVRAASVGILGAVGAGLGALVGSQIRTAAWEDASLPREPWHDPGDALRAANRQESDPGPSEADPER